MRRQRPTSVLVIAILNLVFAGLGLIYSSCMLPLHALALYLEQGRDGVAQADLRAYLEKRLPGYTDIEISHVALPLLFAVVLVVAGIGLLTMQRWARWLSIACGLLIIVSHIGYTIFEVGFATPFAEEWRQGYNKMYPGAAPPFSQAEEIKNLVLRLGPGVVFSVHALALLIIMFRPGVAKAFARRNGNQLDQADDEYDRWPGERDESNRWPDGSYYREQEK